MKLNKKLTSILVTGAMIASIGGTTAMTSFAEEPANPTEGTSVAISKQLNIPQGLSTQAETFIFEFASEDAGAPAIDPIEIAYAAGEVDEDADGYIMKTEAYDLNDAEWTTAGIFNYKVTETEGATEGMDYSKAKFNIKVFVVNDGNGGFEVKDVVATNEAGDKVKVDTPETPEKNEDGSENKGDMGASGANFVNTYTKIADSTPTDDGDPETPDTPVYPDEIPDDGTPENASFVVTKTVEGTYGDTTKQFAFSLSVDTSKTYVENPQIKYYKVDAKGKVTVADPANFTLAHGEKLIVEGAPIGTTYDVEENLNADDVAKKYGAKLDLTQNAVASVIGEQTAGVNVKAEKALVGEKENEAAYTNKNVTDDDTTPTGILMQNAPYILVATLAAGGLVIYLAKRREEEEEA